MNVVLVSQCRKNALKETRRVLDQFAERRGERTWQTPITKAGLDTLRRMLRKNARKNTAVACHWIRGRDHSELLWVVGDASRFNFRGAVPTHTTRSDILRSRDENDWHTLTDIHLLASLAALFHDFGKACQAFQDKLTGKNTERNRYRHEWISLRLLQAFVGDSDDADWLARLRHPEAIDEAHWLSVLVRDGQTRNTPLPLADLPPIARTVGWLVIGHHRLPVLPSYDENEAQQRIGRKSTRDNADSIPDLPDGIHAGWNEIDAPDDAATIAPYWTFPHGLPSRSHAWCKRATRIARQSLARQSMLGAVDIHNPYALHIARLCLMLADHHYSSLSDQARHRPTAGDTDFPLFANTDSENVLAQRLDDHLLGVTREVGAISHRLPDSIAALPRIARHKGFRKRSKDARFRWQDRAFDLSASLRDRSERQGFFGINMASTGCGKTLANGRICYALSDPDRGTRFTIALGLRTLTLQTGSAYRRDLNLSSDDLAVRVGGQASRALFHHREAELDTQGRSSAEPLFDSDSYVHFDGRIDEHPLLSRVVKSPHARSLIAAPILVCTIDHLMPATESLRGGGQIAPMLRLMGADLILDEPDDFGQSDMPALCRLVYWTGLLGSRLILSSATLPPAMVEGLFRAYRAGRAELQKNRGEPGQPLDICCAWFDEHDRVHHDCSDSASFRARHDAFAVRRATALSKAMPHRRARITELGVARSKRDELPRQFAEALQTHAMALHEHHHETDPHTGHRVSFGLIRMANIGPLFDIARALYALDAPPGVRFHLCVYHAQFPLLARSAIETRLDAALDRRDPAAVYELADIRRHLDHTTEPDQLFIVLGSPVTEVGRDHDYDWAVVEPSSMRSIIQLAGRVRRHRLGEAEHDNIILLERNWRALTAEPGEPVFRRPGFEDGDHRLASHALSQLLAEEEYRIVDARPRLVAREPLDARHSLVDLEHARMADDLLAPAAPPEPTQPSRGRRRRNAPATPALAAHSAYSRPDLWLTGVLAQQQRFREQTAAQVELVLLPNEDETDYQLVQSEPQKFGPPKETAVEGRFNRRIGEETLTAERITPWANADYMTELAALATARDMDLEQCARLFGTIQMDASENGWLSHPLLGFRKT
ncbi:type I-F CRISPR-associated helicase Cas3f [Salinisphaera orenii]|uniref:CRISPR-associated protein Cas3 n=1 Tax=Salinisphaera orenii YIM 95161 TaxID=1051139 RepID=A0A423PYV1_9GAMM|nr:type I-F CRISPR-associated helicase Cas3f [Salinisphaera halophila]ROO30784.1 CRISPR-associated protein Cas3 [Salinisphaera halophila YIM 95161]